MGVVERVLPATRFATLAEYTKQGGGKGIEAARELGPAGILDEVDASGLRGRGGAGFPAGRKWRTVAANAAADAPSSVVVNAAEGEPGCFKDRAIIDRNPYAVLEGAVIAALAIGATQVIVAMKRTFTEAIERIDHAITEIDAAGWAEGIDVGIIEGPTEYLFGEETGLLEVIDGRPPFPRVAPPFRHGVEELTETADAVGGANAAGLELAGPGSESVAPPTLASNVETYANVPAILANGADWFRSVGTQDSPGTIVCTVSGRTQRHGVAEMALGTPLREIIDTIGGGVEAGHEVAAVMSGVANALVTAEHLDAPASYEGLTAVGSGLGAAGFIVFDDTTDFAAVAAGVERFLSVESCGQCEPCKRDGLTISGVLERALRDDAKDGDADTLESALTTVADSARCNLARQQEDVTRSILSTFPDALKAHHDGRAPVVEPEPIAAIDKLVDGRFVLDAHELAKLPDWTHDDVYSGKWPAQRLDDPRKPEALD
jgi:NADH-quinone oxidoreductase subunit F